MIPSGCRVPLPVSSPTSAAFPKRLRGSASPTLPRKETLCGMSFRDRRYSLRSGLPVCSPPRSPLPLRRKARRAAVTFTPEQIMHRYLCMHRAC
jgi:hypothetical protein